uniref:Uncharacterized protein n=1 Tax=Cryptococcus bacillisporus CA1280 TaxID=1296109 RepID=A0A0D0TM27_CRYGA|nr:hypothetical protein I312_02849 [Cryptococcus bacillisporus CA1280]
MVRKALDPVFITCGPNLSDSAVSPVSQNGNQRVVISPSINWYPPPSDLRQHYCDLHQSECLHQRTPVETNPTERSNTTLEDDLTQGRGLKHIDWPGVGLAFTLLLIILFAIHANWPGDGEKEDMKKEKGSSGSRSDSKDRKASNKTEGEMKKDKKESRGDEGKEKKEAKKKRGNEKDNDKDEKKLSSKSSSKRNSAEGNDD